MRLTKEQENIIQALQSPSTNFVKIDAISGSGKTKSLIEVAKALNVKRGLYISYNKAIAEEAASKFPFGVQCKTIHSLAYGFTVKQFPLKLVPSLKSKIIKEKIDPIRKSFLIEVLTKYFLSRHTIIKDFVDEFYPNLLSEKEVDLLREYFVKMKDGLCECSHDFYLKLFHILLHHRIVKMTEFDFLALDEAGDVNGASLEIFRLIPAKKRIMVGDKQQNIYSFNQTINGFNALSQEGRLLSLSQSFRVSDQISPYVENFCRKFLDKNMVFKGVKYQEPVKQTEATFFYISRTNAGVVKRMIELDEMNIRYNLTRPVKTLFALPLLLLRIKKDPSHEITLPEYTFLKEDMEKYVNNQKLQDSFPNPISYIEDLHSDDISIVTAANLIKRFSPQGIVTAYNNALEHEKHPETHKVTVTSAHSSKGLESTVVYIEDDLNKALTITIEKFNDAVHEKIVKDKEVLGNAFNPKDKKYELFDIENPNMELLNNKQIEEFRLYYVAVTRAMLQVHNAEWLEEPEISTTFSLITNRGDFE